MSEEIEIRDPKVNPRPGDQISGPNEKRMVTYFDEGTNMVRYFKEGCPKPKFVILNGWRTWAKYGTVTEIGGL